MNRIENASQARDVARLAIEAAADAAVRRAGAPPATGGVLAMTDYAINERRKWIRNYQEYLIWAEQILATRARLVTPERQALRNITQGT